MTIREQLEETEAQILSPKACLSRDSRGRVREEAPHSFRTGFQRDRDRILHSKSFRRLKHKTQVFLAPYGDHYRTRLTHTLEVSAIARTIARALRLNEDLATLTASVMGRFFRLNSSTSHGCNRVMVISFMPKSFRKRLRTTDWS